MRRLWAVLLALALFGGGAGTAAAQTISFRNVAARVVIVPEQRPDIQVIFLKTNPRLPMKLVKGLGDTTRVEPANWTGWLWGPHASCEGQEDRPMAVVPSVGQVTYDDLPQITVRVPMQAKVVAGGAIYGSVGRSQSLKLLIAGCGEWTLANVRDELSVDFDGSGRLHTGSAGTMTLRIAGAATTTTTEVGNGLTLGITGSGNVHVRSVSGPLGVRVAGGGEVRIDGGRATTMAVHIAGSGDVRYGGVADSLDANIAGSGDINVAKVLGRVTKFVAGSGSVEAGQ